MPLKKALRQQLVRGQLDEVAETAVSKKRVLGLLVSLTFDADPQIGWRAVEAMGLAAGRIAEDDPQYVRNHLRRLQWLLSEESGGICWRAPEAMAEIVRRKPKRFADYIPIVVFLILNMAEEDLVHFRAGALWAIARLAGAAEDQVPAVLSAVVSALDNSDPQVRGMAVWCLGRLGHTPLLAAREELLRDEGPVDLYEDRLLSRTSVGDLARRAVEAGRAKG